MRPLPSRNDVAACVKRPCHVTECDRQRRRRYTISKTVVDSKDFIVVLDTYTTTITTTTTTITITTTKLHDK
ncbi:hypothetical protein M0802_001402 [Mischocyttarus mexicanus]|nr:hypothetical protein M0802_001402 [Mischocyttarus mexicanus]